MQLHTAVKRALRAYAILLRAEGSGTAVGAAECQCGGSSWCMGPHRAGLPAPQRSAVLGAHLRRKHSSCFARPLTCIWRHCVCTRAWRARELACGPLPQRCCCAERSGCASRPAAGGAGNGTHEGAAVRPATAGSSTAMRGRRAGRPSRRLMAANQAARATAQPWAFRPRAASCTPSLQPDAPGAPSRRARCPLDRCHTVQGAWTPQTRRPRSTTHASRPAADSLQGGGQAGSRVCHSPGRAHGCGTQKGSMKAPTKRQHAPMVKYIALMPCPASIQAHGTRHM